MYIIGLANIYYFKFNGVSPNKNDTPIISFFR